jgi:hypothetical protein
MQKPKAKQTEAVLDYHEVIDFIQKKYGYNARDFSNYFGHDKNKPKGKEFEDFWGWLVEDGSIHNGCHTYLPFDFIDDDDTPKYVRTILKDIRTEFDPENKMDSLKVWVEW